MKSGIMPWRLFMFTPLSSELCQAFSNVYVCENNMELWNKEDNDMFYMTYAGTAASQSLPESERRGYGEGKIEIILLISC